MAKALIVNSGDVYGNFTVIKEVEKHGRTRMFLFKCICGNEVVRQLGAIKGLFIKSCGCMRVYPKLTTTHVMSRTKLYSIWRDMKNRCIRPKTTGYQNYGGRGIKIFENWLKFEPFMHWAIANGYKEGLSIERIDVNGNYCPENCKWIPMIEQSKNRRNVNYIDINGVNKSMAEWCRIYKIPISRVIARKKYGWDLKKAILTPPNPPKRKIHHAT